MHRTQMSGDAAHTCDVILAAGGTAGHIAPALSMAEALRSKDSQLRIGFIGGMRGLESHLVRDRGWSLHTVDAVPLPRSVAPSQLPAFFGVLRATRQARRLLTRLKPRAVVGFGGYVAAPVYLAARSLGIPLLVHEANARPGLANRLGARLTHHVLTATPVNLPHSRVIGIPLDQRITVMNRDTARRAARMELNLPLDGPLVLVFGGSQGARRINEAVAGALPALQRAGLVVLHAVGRSNPLPPSEPGYHPVPYLDRMDLAYAAADLAVTRAGALTCAELAAVGLPAIYVPLPIGNGEQALNATPTVQAGGGVLLPDESCTASELAKQTITLLHDPDGLARMGRAAKSHGHGSAATELAELVTAVMQQKDDGR